MGAEFSVSFCVGVVFFIHVLRGFVFFLLEFGVLAFHLIWWCGFVCDIDCGPWSWGRSSAFQRYPRRLRLWFSGKALDFNDTLMDYASRFSAKVLVFQDTLKDSGLGFRKKLLASKIPSWTTILLLRQKSCFKHTLTDYASGFRQKSWSSEIPTWTTALIFRSSALQRDPPHGLRSLVS